MDDEKLKKYLETSIDYWREKRKNAKDSDIKLKCIYYVDALQSVYIFLFRSIYPRKK